MPPHSAFFHCLLLKKPYHPLQCFIPLCAPQKATLAIEESYGGDTVEKSTVRDDMAFWGVHSGKKALIAHLSPQKAALPQKPPI